jgi:hypothetical protein
MERLGATKKVTRIAKTLRNMVGPNGLEPSTSSVSRKRSNQTELRAYRQTVVVSILMGARDYGNVWATTKVVSRALA